MIRLVAKIIYNNIRGRFLFHLMIHMMISSFFLPTINKICYDRLTSNGSGNIDSGIMIYFGFIMLEIITNYHNLHFIEPFIRNFRGDAHASLEGFINDKFQSLNWNIIRELQKEEIERIKNDAIWPLLGLIDTFVRQGIQLFPFIGYTLWLFYFSPFSVILYIFGISLTIYWYPLSTQEYDKYHELWDRYSFLSTSKFTEIIHYRGKENAEELNKTIKQIEDKIKNDGLERTKFFECINLAFNLIFGANVVLFARSISSVTNIVIYLQYSNLIKNGMNFFGNIYKQYCDTKKYYDKLNNNLLSKPNREIVEPINNFEQITISMLEYRYPMKNNSSNDNDANSFGLTILKPIIMQIGQIIRLDGDSGNGKSTFMEIISGIIPYSEYRSEILYDNIYYVCGFDAITIYRVYAEQFEQIKWKPSIYEIITGQIDFNYDDENLVKRALNIAQCQDFVKFTNNTNDDRKWIHTKNINPSGGQKGRISIARIIYYVLKYQPKIVILDEIDKSIQANLAVKIMLDIFDYCRQNKIICLVAAHSTEVKNMGYDLILHFNKGEITPHEIDLESGKSFISEANVIY